MYADQYAIHIGILSIHYYALILMAGMLVAAWIVARRAKEQGMDANEVWNGLLWAIIPGLIGARIYHILTPSPASGLSLDYYLHNPLQMLAINQGGLGIYGGIIGAALGVMYYARRRKQPILKWLDLIAPALAMGQAIGRWGNFVNNELYGAPTNLPWAITIPPQNRLPGYEQFATYHPLFLYESIWDLASFGVLLLIERRFRDKLLPGDLALIYLILYPTGRFLLDFVRLDSNGFGVITTAQLLSAAACLVALILLIARHRVAYMPRTNAHSRE